MVSLQRQVANAYGYEESVYDPLLDEYEPGMTCRQMEVVFGEVKGKLIRWVASCEAVVEVKKSLEAVEIPSAPQQAALANWAARAIGFDFQRGRLDESVHPFTLGISSRDVRLTNRFSWADPVRVVLATLHEAGHGLYRQAIDPKYDGTLLGQPTSCGMDEAQARLWENMIGRSRAFWTFARRRMQKLLGGDNGLAVADEIHDRINGVRPSPVRIDADEVTYNLHIILRFEIERELLAGGIDVEELPSLWNRRMEEYLGVYPRDDAEGILQDIHWADGCFGYFPTYTLGNLYAAQIFAAACADLPHIEAQIERGCFAPLRRWLREKVYRHGRRFTATELMVRATGKPPSSESFLNYLKAKVSLKSGRRRSV
jgi:carboxypeptidase Taq